VKGNTNCGLDKVKLEAAMIKIYFVTVVKIREVRFGMFEMLGICITMVEGREKVGPWHYARDLPSSKSMLCRSYHTTMDDDLPKLPFSSQCRSVIGI
jgi:hypothetical protein